MYNTENSQTFTLGSSENLGGSISGNRVAIVVSDFNKDGIASDVALLNTVTNRVEIYPRNLTGIPGSFYLHTPSSYLNATTNLMLSIALGDLDGSSGQDIAAVTQNGKLLIFLQPSYGFTSTSDFYPDSVIHLAGKPSSISVGDVNDDGLTDILIGYADSPRLAAYLRTGPATFVNTFNLTTGAAPAAVMAQDVNGDGRTDISCASPGSHSISIWFQNNLAPVAKIGGPSSQYRTVLTSFNVASSLDSYSDIGSLNYTWAFGDGTPGYGKTVSHAYQDIGKFNITLRVTDRGGLYTTNTLIITVLQTYPSADLTIWPELPSEGSWILFNDMSLRSTVSNSPIQTWQWMFDGVNGNITKNAKQRFGAGEHTVMLKVTDANGVTNSTPLRFFNVTEVQPMAGFTISSAKVGSPVYFNSTSSFAWTPIVIYNWSFGDGNMTSGANPSVEYTFNMKGSYQIALKVTDAKGFSDEMVQWLHVNPTLPKATISLDGQSIEGSLTKFIISTSSFNPIVSWNWSYDNNQTWHLSNDNVTGTSFTFANNGTYWVSLNVTERDGSWCLISILVDVQDSNPKILRFWAPEGLTCEMDQNVSFWATASSYKNITKYEWNFDYGNGGTWVASTPFQTNHTSWSFNKPGIHFVKVRVWDDDGYTEYYSYPGLEIRVVDQAATALSIESLALLALVIAIITTILIFLIYRTLVPVDEVFIIFQDGQLMAHQTRRIKPGMDDDILASMFVAIQMFVKDSFKDESSTGLNRMDFGKKKILVEKGESFYLAVVLHSNRTGSIPKRMQIVIDDIQKNYGPALKVWDGDLEKVRGVKDSVNSLVKRKRPFGNK
ncbi:MAG: PKD domain-containing protein [Methanomassiliicoccales archaeon]